MKMGPGLKVLRQISSTRLICFARRATTALRLKFEVCKELRNHMELLPKTGYIQAQSQFSAQLKFLPRYCSSNVVNPYTAKHDHRRFQPSPANIKHLYNICTMLDQRRRRWADIIQILYKCIVFAGSARWF